MKANFTGLGNKAVTVTGTVTDAYDLNAILKATSGVVTAAIAEDIAVLKGALTDAKGTDKLVITVNDVSVNAADLKALDAKTARTIDASTNVNDLIGTAADIKAVLKAVANGGIELAADVNIAPTGTISAADANAFFLAAPTGTLTATVTAGSASALNKALKDVPTNDSQVLTLKVTGATATAVDLTTLDSKTFKAVDASAVKTMTGSVAELQAVYAGDIALNASLNATVTGVVTVAAAALETLLGSVGGKVTATVAPSTAAELAPIFNAGKPIDALTFNVVEDIVTAPGFITATDAGDLVDLDNQTSVKVKVDATQITGTYAELEHVYVSGKAGFSNLGNETVTFTGTTTAARVDSILKATTGVVTAAAGVIGAETAEELVRNLKNAKNDALVLEITSGSVANAADLKALDAKTTVAIDADNISKLVGNAADVKTVLAATTGINLGAAKDIDVSGTISAADANTIALNVNAGVVTATVKADTAAKLNDALGALGGVDKLSLTVTGTSADAAHLNSLNVKTAEAVNASAIKTVTGIDTSIAALYAAGAAEVSGLGNEAVSVTGEASAVNITSINTATTGLINVASVNTALAANGAFALSTGLGNLDGITGLYNLSAADGFDTAITFSIADLLAANDSSKSFDFSIVGDGAAGNDTVAITNTSGWTVANNTTDLSQYVFTKGSQTITINLTDIDAATVI